MNKIPTTSKNRQAQAAVIAALIAMPCEGLRQIAYYCPAGILTACYGSTNNVQVGKRYTLDECKARLTAEMQEAINAVDRCVPGLPVEVLAAFGDAAFNGGPKIACDRKQSTAARYLHQGQLIAACNQLPRWNRARVAGVMVALPGLTKRRAAEQQLCLQGARA